MPKNLAEVVEKRRKLERDIRTASYVAPFGLGMHLVRVMPGGEVRAVGSTVGQVTFNPGDRVFIGCESGGRQWVILGFPPPGLLGGGAFADGGAIEGSVDSLALTAASPDEAPAGAVDFPIFLIGRGFSEDPLDVFACKVADPDTGELSLDPLATAHDPEWIADPAGEGLTVLEGQTVVRVLVDVSAEAPTTPPLGPYKLGFTVDRA